MLPVSAPTGPPGGATYYNFIGDRGHGIGYRKSVVRANTVNEALKAYADQPSNFSWIPY